MKHEFLMNKNELNEQFKIYSALPAMSTASERLFSSAGYQVWDRRKKISPEKVNQVNFIVENEDL
jgi:hypothetical protein